MEPHACTACPECDDVSNECCRLCAGSDSYCPICKCPADDCEFQVEVDDDFEDEFYESDSPFDNGYFPGRGQSRGEVEP